MNLDKSFVKKMLSIEVKEYHESIKEIMPHMVYDDGRKAFRFIIEHVKSYHKLPDESIIKAETGVSFDEDAPEPIEYYIDSIKERYLFNRVGKSTEEIVGAIEKHDGKKAFEILEKAAHDIRSEELAGTKTKSIISLGDKILEQYTQHKAGMITGVKSPYPMLDEYTLGWQPEDMVVVVARPGTGKTWLLTAMAESAWEDGMKVFFVSPEISDVKLAQRFLALHLKLPYMDMRRGRLGAFLEPQLFDGVKKLMKEDEKRFMTLSSEFGVDLPSIRAGIIDFQPDIVFLDGLYLIDTGDKWADRFSRVSAAADELKKINRKFGVPIITSTQFNRNVKPGKRKMSLEDLGLSDVIGWNADWCFGMFQDKDMKLDGKMTLIPLKTRESENIDDLELNWNFTTMDFSEIGTVSPTASYSEKSTSSAWDTPDDSDEEDIPF
jgi:replicative DNA helicase